MPGVLKPKGTLVLGIMSGTSLDGVDHALCRVEKGRICFEDLWRRPFPAPLRRRLIAAAEGTCGSHELGQLHHDLGRFYAQAARAGLDGRQPALAGLHGQTVFHQPRPRSPATLQLGEPAYLAEALGCSVVANFRAADLAAGGQGAPLATAFHLAVFGRPGRHLCVNNLGGISNVTSINARASGDPKVLAFDTGPANLLLDLAARHYSGGRRRMDRGGTWAGRGRADPALVSRWLRHPYFRRIPPKSTGRELFGQTLFKRFREELQRRGRSHEDALATLTAWTAHSIALNYRLHLPARPDEIILCGGGAANPTLVRALDEAFRSQGMRPEMRTSEAQGWPLSSVEAAAFAWLAWLRMEGRPGNVPPTTGIRRPLLLGQVVEGRPERR